MEPSIKNLVTKDLVVIHWSENLQSAAEIMKAKKIRHLPVVDESGHVVGLLSDRDLSRVSAVLEKFGVGLVVPTLVRDAMSWPVITADEDTSVVQVAQRMLDNKISSVIITKNDQVRGIVTNQDMLRFMVANVSKSGSAKDKVLEWFYNSPVGQIATTLSNAGI
jgi:acetoin utilization protein AcuB